MDFYHREHSHHSLILWKMSAEWHQLRDRNLSRSNCFCSIQQYVGVRSTAIEKRKTNKLNFLCCLSVHFECVRRLLLTAWLRATRWLIGASFLLVRSLALSRMVHIDWKWMRWDAKWSGMEQNEDRAARLVTSQLTRAASAQHVNRRPITTWIDSNEKKNVYRNHSLFFCLTFECAQSGMERKELAIACDFNQSVNTKRTNEERNKIKPWEIQHFRFAWFFFD